METINIKYAVFSIICLFLSVSLLGQDKSTRTCLSTKVCEELCKNPNYRTAFDQKLAFFKTKGLATRDKAGDCLEKLRIPVAIHFNNIASTEQTCLKRIAQEQILSLNADFQASNSDLQKYKDTYAPFFPDVTIQPTCFSFEIASLSHPLGYDLQDGDLAITVNRVSDKNLNSEWSGYLNIFVFVIEDGILGYSPLGGEGNGDGVAVTKFAFGGGGTRCGAIGSDATFGSGRTLTHEVGHWLFLNHIWGDGDCAIDDGVEDTPPSDSPIFGKPSQLRLSCGVRNLHMDYMDYTDDDAMYLFTGQQVERMERYVAVYLQGVTNKGKTVLPQKEIEIIEPEEEEDTTEIIDPVTEDSVDVSEPEDVEETENEETGADESENSLLGLLLAILTAILGFFGIKIERSKRKENTRTWKALYDEIRPLLVEMINKIK